MKKGLNFILSGLSLWFALNYATPVSAEDYTVGKGDNLSNIAEKHGLPLQEIIEANPKIENPDLINLGQSINIPYNHSDKSANNFSPEMLDQFKAEIKQRYKAEDSTWLIFENKLKQLSDSWLEKISNYNLKYYYHKNEVHLLDKPSEIFEKTKTEGSIYHSTDWSIMQSMREIDTSSFIKIELPKVRRV